MSCEGSEKYGNCITVITKEIQSCAFNTFDIIMNTTAVIETVRIELCTINLQRTMTHAFAYLKDGNIFMTGFFPFVSIDPRLTPALMSDEVKRKI